MPSSGISLPSWLAGLVQTSSASLWYKNEVKTLQQSTKSSSWKDERSISPEQSQEGDVPRDPSLLPGLRKIFPGAPTISPQPSWSEASTFPFPPLTYCLGPATLRTHSFHLLRFQPRLLSGQFIFILGKHLTKYIFISNCKNYLQNMKYIDMKAVVYIKA